MAPMVRVQVQFTAEQADRLRRDASRRGWSVAELVRAAVDAYFDSDATSAARRRALDAVGGFRSGARDTAERHDDALTDAYR